MGTGREVSEWWQKGSSRQVGHQMSIQKAQVLSTLKGKKIVQCGAIPPTCGRNELWLWWALRSSWKLTYAPNIPAFYLLLPYTYLSTSLAIYQLWSESLCLPKFTSSHSEPKGHGNRIRAFGRLPHYRGRALSNKINTLIKWGPRVIPSNACTMWGHSKEMLPISQKEDPHRHWISLYLGLPSLQDYEKFCCWHFDIIAWML